MSRLIDEQVVRHVAGLARLRLTDQEVARFARELAGILDYVAQMNELDISGIEPTEHPHAVSNVLRDDAVRPSWSSEQATANAPERENGFFKIPKVLDQGSA